MTPGTCATCRHWTPPEKRTGFSDAIGIGYPSDTQLTLRERADLRAAADTKYGVCTAIRLVDDHNPNDPLPLATVRDASDYIATLYTRAEFGCALHTHPAVEVVIPLPPHTAIVVPGVRVMRDGTQIGVVTACETGDNFTVRVIADEADALRAGFRLGDVSRAPETPYGLAAPATPPHPPEPL